MNKPENPHDPKPLKTSGCRHTHAFNGADQALWMALVLNFCFLIIELVIGLWTNSLALLSDAGHMVSDVAALAIALVAQRLASAKPSGNYTFGLKRAPVLGAFGNALALIAIAGLIIWEAGHRLISPEEVLAAPVLAAGIAGLVVNVVSAWWLHRKGGRSLNIRGAFIHLVADSLGSLGAVIASVVLMTTGWTMIDPIVSVAIALLILAATWPLLRDSTKVLLQTAPAGINLKTLSAALCEHPGVEGTQHMHVWEIDSGLTILTAVLITNNHDLAELEKVADELRDRLHEQFDIWHSSFEWRTCRDDNNKCRL